MRLWSSSNESWGVNGSRIKTRHFYATEILIFHCCMLIFNYNLLHLYSAFTYKGVICSTTTNVQDDATTAILRQNVHHTPAYWWRGDRVRKPISVWGWLEGHDGQRPVGKFGQDAGVMLGILMTTGSQDLGLMSHPKDGTTKPVISSMGIFVAIANNSLYGSKLLFFSFMQTIIRILSKVFLCGSVVEHCVSCAKGCGFDSQGTHVLMKMYNLNVL